MARVASRVAAISHWTNSHNKDSAIAEIEDSKKSAMGTAAKENKNFLHDLIKRVDGLYAIIISDREGIPVVRAWSDKLPESVAKSSFLATVSIAFDQAGKLGLGKNDRIMCFFTTYQVIHLNKFPLAVSLIASSKANTGLLLNLEPELSNLIEDLRIAIATM